MKVLNRSLKFQVCSLRKQGKTFRQISDTLGIALSTVHLWSKEIHLTQEQKEAINRQHLLVMQGGRVRAQKAKRLIRQINELKIMKSEVSKVGTLSKRELYLLGAGLYWAEGFKKDRRLGFANSDPHMIKLILKWMIDIVGIDKKDIRFRVGINQSHKYRIDEITEYWVNTTGFSSQCFQKPYLQKTTWRKKYPNSASYYGVLRIRANKHRNSYVQILGMIEGLRRII